jgi:predicted naringenin-chalcone synthase
MTDEVSRELKNFDETGKITPRLSEILKLMPLEDLFSMKPRPAVTSRDSLVCSACSSTLNAVMEYIRTHSVEDVLNLVATLCTQLVNFNENVCTGVVGLNMVSGFLEYN